MRRFVLCLSALALVSGCGQKNISPGENATPSPALATGLEAIRIARQAVPTASGVARLAVSFPRPNGTAEYWSVLLFDLESPSSYQQVEIQGKETVEVRTSDAPADSGVPVSFEVVKVDTSQAERTVRRLDWTTGPEIEVALNPVAFDIGGDDAPSGLRGRAAWHFVITRKAQGAPELVGAVWVSVDTGEIVEAQRT